MFRIFKKMNVEGQQEGSSQESQNPQQNTAKQPQQQVNIFACQERLDDRRSPELFKEPITGAWDLHREYITIKSKEEREQQNNRFRTELEPDDVKMVNELGHLSADKLMDYVRTLQSTSISLGEEEATQFSRAKLLKILEDKNHPS